MQHNGGFEQLISNDIYKKSFLYSKILEWENDNSDQDREIFHIKSVDHLFRINVKKLMTLLNSFQ